MLWLWMAGCAGPAEPPASWPTEGCGARAPQPESVAQTTREDLRLLLPDGVELAVAVRTPDGLDCAGAVVEAPPGFEAGADRIDEEQARTLARAGLLVLTFDPRGRGESGGEEDINGHTGQDDFAALMRWAASREDVDPTRVVVWSRSIGGALASGALGRHADLAPHAWVDYESPAWLEENLEHATEFTRERMWELANESEDPSAWMDERSPAATIGEVRTRYHRLQGVPDHALDYLAAAVTMLNGAENAEIVTLNGEEITWEITEPEVKERAVQGGLEPLSDTATDAVLAAFEP